MFRGHNRASVVESLTASSSLISPIAISSSCEVPEIPVTSVVAVVVTLGRSGAGRGSRVCKEPATGTSPKV